MGKEASSSYESLQACRGIAALLVVLFHLGPANRESLAYRHRHFARALHIRLLCPWL